MVTQGTQSVQDAWGWVTQKRKLRRGLRAEWGPGDPQRTLGQPRGWEETCPGLRCVGASRTQLQPAQPFGGDGDQLEPGFLTGRAWAQHGYGAKLLKIKQIRLGKTL